ncbi:MAG: hypothetical protein M1836_005469 [Candelina mexicana]|nr:MAG: hypothetical protein M1836_005469 [Candelina mexicana]
MVSINDPFMKADVPGTKRKLDSTLDRNAIYKSARHHVNGETKTKGRTIVEDEAENDELAGPELPPDGEEPAPDDEDGRFFGGGISGDTAEVLDFIDEREKDEAQVSYSSGF